MAPWYAHSVPIVIVIKSFLKRSKNAVHQDCQVNSTALDKVCTELQLTDVRLGGIREDRRSTRSIGVEAQVGANGHRGHRLEPVLEAGEFPVWSPSKFQNQCLRWAFGWVKKKRETESKLCTGSNTQLQFSISGVSITQIQTYVSDVSRLSWRSTQVEWYSGNLKRPLALGSQLGEWQWLRPHDVGCKVLVLASTAVHQAHTHSRTHPMFWLLGRRNGLSGKLEGSIDKKSEENCYLSKQTNLALAINVLEWQNCNSTTR